MALIGTGVVPAGIQGTELQVVTRRAFVPKMVVQIWKATPALGAILANAQPASGGVSSITVPVQGAPFVAAQATDYSGAFTAPATQQGAFEFDANLCAVVTPIFFGAMEGLLQNSAAVIPLVEARMNDAGNATADYLNTQLWTNQATQTINIDGFQGIAGVATANGQGIYGNINGTTYSWWRANYRAETAAPPTRLTVMADIVSAAKAASGESPNIGFMGPNTWMQLAADFIGQETYMVTPEKSFDQVTMGARSAFTAIMVAGVPIYLDLSCPEGVILLINTRYLSAYIHEAAAFVFTGFQSTLANNVLGYIGAVVVLLQLVCVKRSTVTWGVNYTTTYTL